jgi:hypothetical protein
VVGKKQGTPGKASGAAEEDLEYRACSLDTQHILFYFVMLLNCSLN